jgi:hypothetical protein
MLAWWCAEEEMWGDGSEIEGECSENGDENEWGLVNDSGVGSEYSADMLEFIYRKKREKCK